MTKASTTLIALAAALALPSSAAAYKFPILPPGTITPIAAHAPEDTGLTKLLDHAFKQKSFFGVPIAGRATH